MEQLTDNEILLYLNHGFEEDNLNEGMSSELKSWANETIMQSLGIEGFLEEKEMYGVE